MTPLVAGLLSPDAYPHPAPGLRLIETHISWVFLAGEYAYKVKKPVNLGFLDFSTLEKRRFFCEEEIRLNRRLAPEIYLDVASICGSEQAPRVDGQGEVVEWAVEMRAFPADATLDRETDINTVQIDAIADRVAAFHQTVSPASPESNYGTPDAVRQPIEANFTHLRSLRPPREILDHLAPTENWSRNEGARLEAAFAQRKAAGFVRECHGDLHLGNIAWADEAPIIFDGIEFNPGLRFIDVMSDVGFLAMDLHFRGRHDLAWRFLNRYLENTGDFAGLDVLLYYQVYRAMVRAKVAAIRTSQAGGDGSECLAYLNLANRLMQPPRPALYLMYGVSGSGKTWLSQGMLERLGAIRLRSDVERKRLYGLAPAQDSRAIVGDIYTPEAGARTLDSLLVQARALLTAGFPVIVDATFLARSWRLPFQELAKTLAVPWRIIAPEVPSEVLRRRVSERMAKGRDASEADLEVLAAQLESGEPLTQDELGHTLRLSGPWTIDDAVNRLQSEMP